MAHSQATADPSRLLGFWTADPDLGPVRARLADLAGVTWALLDGAGELPPDLPPAESAVVVADWARLAADPAHIERWQGRLDPTPLAVLVLAPAAALPAALGRLRPEAPDDVVEAPATPAVLAHRIRRAFQALEARRLDAELERQVADFREFHRVALALSAEHDVNRLLELILAKCREVTTADAGSLYLVEEKEPDPGQWEDRTERVLRFVVAQNDSKPLDLQSARLPLNRSSIAGYVVLTGTPLNIRDIYHLPPEAEFSAATARRLDQAIQYRTISMLAIPLVDHAGQVIGVVQVINKKRSRAVRLETPEVAEREVLPFGPRDQELVLSLASLAGVTLDKALLISRIERLLEGIVRASVTAIEQRDPATRGHSDRVARYTVGLARVVDAAGAGPYAHVRFSREELKELEYAALLHDIGKVGVREPVLLKAKKLYEPELELVRARFDFIRRTWQYEYARRMLETLVRLGPDAARPHLKALEEELERRLEEVDRQLELVVRVNEPTVLRAEVSAALARLAAERYPYLDGSERPILTEYEFRNLCIPQGSLNDEERREIESHVTHSFRFLMQIPWTKELRRVPLIAYSHHERLDGSGYPRGVQAPEIPIQARMMAIADVYDALTAADRPYKRAVSPERALDILRAEAGQGRLDRDLLDLFVEARVYAVAVPDRRPRRA